MENVYYKFKQDIGSQAAKYIDQLDLDGQIDRDNNSDPYVTGYERIPGTNMVRINVSRDGQQHTLTMNPRARTGPDRSTFDPKDGWKRKDGAPQQVHPLQAKPGGERQKRPTQQPPQQAPSAATPAQAPTSMPVPQQPVLQGRAAQQQQQRQMRRESYEAALARLLR